MCHCCRARSESSPHPVHEADACTEHRQQTLCAPRDEIVLWNITTAAQKPLFSWKAPSCGLKFIPARLWCPQWMRRGPERGARRTGSRQNTALWLGKHAWSRESEGRGEFGAHFSTTAASALWRGELGRLKGTAGLKEWGDARCNMDIRGGITIGDHHGGRTQVSN